MKIVLTESQLRKFISNQFGLDLSGKISMVQSKNDLPSVFDWIPRETLNLYLNQHGPMYLIEQNGVYYLAQNHGNRKKNNWLIINQSDFTFTEFEFMKGLGIEKLGLSMNQLIDEFFVEEPLYEQVSEKYDDNMTKIIQSYLDMNLDNYYGIKKFWVDYNEQMNGYDINIFFDKQLAIEIGLGVNMLRRRALTSISQELNSMFQGLKFYFYDHYED